jgi:hypothetical protein
LPFEGQPICPIEKFSFEKLGNFVPPIYLSVSEKLSEGFIVESCAHLGVQVKLELKNRLSTALAYMLDAPGRVIRHKMSGSNGLIGIIYKLNFYKLN